MDDEEEQIKCVYATFGVAIYYAQCLEYAIVNSLVSLNLIPEYANRKANLMDWPTILDSFMDNHFETTLGTMINSLKNSAPITDDLEQKLNHARKKRNWLAHAYFRERAEYFFTEQNRLKMIEELDQAKDFFHETSQLLEDTFKSFRLKYGITDEMIEKEFHNLIANSTDLSE